MVVLFQEVVHPFQEVVLPFQEALLPFQEVVLPFQEVVLTFQEVGLPFQEVVLPSQEVVLPFQEVVLPFCHAEGSEASLSPCLEGASLPDCPSDFGASLRSGSVVVNFFLFLKKKIIVIT